MRKHKISGSVRGVILGRVVREGFSGQETFEVRPDEGVTQSFWAEGIAKQRQEL